MGQNKSKYTYQEGDWPFVWALWDARVLDWKKGMPADQTLAISQAQNDLPVEITPTLYLGNCQYIQNLDNLEQLGIQHVLNMAGDMTAFPKPLDQALRERGITYKVIHAEDEEDYPLLDRHWDDVHEFLQDAHTKDEKVLIHCIAGYNRSALVVAAEYMIRTQTNVVETVHHIRMRRGNVALTNQGFQEQLVALARYHDLLGEAPRPVCPRPQRTKASNPLEKVTV